MNETETEQRSWFIERYRPGDEVDLLALFNSVFNLNRSMEHWTWQFGNNPYAGPLISLARRKGDRMLVGSHVVMPFLLNVKGRPALACHTLDLAVHPEFRMQGIFEKTAQDCFDWCRAQNAQAVISFPNESSYPGFVRTLGWHRILFPMFYSLRLDVASTLRHVLRIDVIAWLPSWLYRSYLRATFRLREAFLTRHIRRVLRFHVESLLPSGYDRLWGTWRSQEVLSLWKDAAYLRWRYDDNPDHAFSYCYLSDGDELIALAVTVDREGTITICEFLVAHRDIAVGRLLLTKMCLHYLARGMRAINFLGHDAGMFADIFVGFRSRIAYENVYCGRSLGDEALDALMANADNWTITFGDADFV